MMVRLRFFSYKLEEEEGENIILSSLRDIQYKSYKFQLKSC